MPIDTSAFGAYTAKYDGTDIGLTEGAMTSSQQFHATDRRADQYGASVISGIYTGADVFLQLIMKEWTTGPKKVVDRLDATPGQSGIIGRAMEDEAKILLLEAVVGTPARTNGPVTRTFAKAIFAPEFNIELPMGNVERDIPIIFRIYPTEVTPGTSELQWFVDT